MKLGVLEETSLKGRKIILEPRTDLPDNLWLVEKGKFFNGEAMYAMHCLVCEEEVPERCPKCNV